MNKPTVTSRLLLLTAIVVLITPSIHGQSLRSNTGDARLGLFGNLDATVNAASFSGLPLMPSCCPEYSTTMSTGWRAGIGYIKPLSSPFTLHIRMMWGGSSTAFTTQEQQPIVSITGEPELATIQHDLTTRMQQLSIEPLLGWSIAPNLSLLGGVTLGYVVSSTFDQRERLVLPVDGVFRNLSRERNVLAGDIPNASSIAAHLTIGASLDLPLNQERTLMVSPEVLLSLSPVGPVANVSWTQQHIRAGLVFSIVPPSIQIDPTDQEVFEWSLENPTSKGSQPAAGFLASISAMGVNDDGTTEPLGELIVREHLSYRSRPVLPYVFFDANTYTVPERYYRISDEQRQQFSMNNFYNLDALTTYRQVLNIVGRRMSDDPTMSIVLTGHASSDERGGSDLALERAQSIQSYLEDVWKIDPSRIEARASQAAPARLSNDASLEAVDQRRVDITSTSADLFADVVSNDTLRQLQPDGIRFTPSTSPVTPIADWRILISRRGVVVHTVRGGEPVPGRVDWRPSPRSAAMSRGTTELNYLLAVTDSNGVVIPTAIQRIPLREIRLTDPDASTVRRDRYSIVFTNAATADLSAQQLQLIQAIQRAIPTGAKVRVVSYTDATGAEDENLNISQRRANNVAKALGGVVTEQRGVGERLQLYDNDTPEARLYSRSVEIYVETPAR